MEKICKKCKETKEHYAKGMCSACYKKAKVKTTVTQKKPKQKFTLKVKPKVLSIKKVVTKIASKSIAVKKK